MERERYMDTFFFSCVKALLLAIGVTLLACATGLMAEGQSTTARSDDSSIQPVQGAPQPGALLPARSRCNHNLRSQLKVTFYRMLLNRKEMGWMEHRRRPSRIRIQLRNEFFGFCRTSARFRATRNCLRRARKRSLWWPRGILLIIQR